MKKKYFLILLTLGIIGLLIGVQMYFKAPEHIGNLKTDYQIDASSLLSAFEDDEISANTKYLDKVIEVNGAVEKKEIKDGKLTAYLETGNPLSNVIFQFENQDEKIIEGEQITLKGICTGYLMDVVMVRAKKI